ncbi:prolipoprotein diacylglyceryl transferase [Beijerinckia indica]|uniref:Phosphatidylglycerol--prolipoprotein diacylglyceryl transferase n=1 Tax=Beijerinckia indica subsp. indica (strain ATCC 9039 / DSM 1715 / NCIMB 8712) TaxID=395963 RepID=LGT_BEII9|nr:prolipoprotein diacylglyceryl transferase [Beijerinckia indica]B2IFJ6.1 RecName: Full=Phosphatidylglycerol--prolipoprotein diacylglyceryl transferase [Beijerinckia indica subsp. indica ATCC 9039]ACB97092.1 prolipoprotein diacylglyceryl transferase [Beijerinckia indica subsp. indica ATCC 9039]
MPLMLVYPAIDPVLVWLGPLPIRWYALAYIAGLLLGWAYARRLAAQPVLWGRRTPPSALEVDDLLVYAAMGVIIGGRLGYVVFYNADFYLEHPLESLSLWKGGMSFHGGLIGTALTIGLLAWRRSIPLAVLTDLAAAAVPIGLCLGRIANFIKPELWGRVADPDFVPFAMVFPGAGSLPRHPSQLYEAFFEGIVLFVILFIAIRLGALRRPGLVTGLFALGYGLARIGCEFFREPDAQLGFLFGGATMGMLLSLPLVLIGLFLVIRAASPKLETA